MALAAIALALARPADVTATVGTVAGFGVILATSLVQLMLPGDAWLVVEETVAPVSAVLIVGLGPERVTVAGALWLCCVACGVLARGGRQHWYGRAVLLVSLAMPFALRRQATIGYAAFCLGSIILLLTCGRVTRELRALLARARHEADHDGLTGLLAGRTFRAELDRVATEARAGVDPQPVGVVLVDLDDFGAVNKRSGHAAGDALLVAVADAIRAAAGERGIAGRLGGDEFGIVLRDADPAASARAILRALTLAPGVQASAGMALAPRDGDDAESLLRAVDVALRVAKRSGQQGLSVYAGESMSQLGPGGARAALRRLVAGDGLAVVVQPIVSVPDGAVHAYEALARFNAGASASPLHWFALADELGMRDELELACLATALRVLPQRPAGAALSVNLSGPLLLDPRAVAQLDSLATLDGLILELTENRLVDDSAAMRGEIARLIARGVRFAVDDMGVGYSGLRQITTLRPSYLKLDRSLVSGIDRDADRGALVAAMVGYARQTGSHLVAEGVETAAELEALIGLGVPLVQGFHLARPAWPWPEVRDVVAAAPAPATPDRLTPAT